MEIYRGTALFSVSEKALTEKLIAERRLRINENISIIRNPAGILLGTPRTVAADFSGAEILEKVSIIWNNELQERTIFAVSTSHITIDADESGAAFRLIWLRTNQGLFFGRLVNESLFSLPASVNYLLNLSIFLSFYLTLFFLLNIRPNKIVIVQNRLKRLHEKIFDQLYENKDTQERTRWIFELQQRREEIKQDIKHKLRLNSRLEKNIDSIIDTSWEKLMVVIKSGGSVTPIQQKAKEFEKIKEETVAELEEIIEIETAEDAVFDLEELEAEETLEESAEAEDIEEIETLEELDEVETVETAETSEKDEDIEEIETLEELDEIESLDEEIDTRKHGLLATASKFEPEPKKPAKGLLATASEFDFSSVYENVVIEDTEEKEENWDTEIDVVSPFSSMFDSLKKEVQEQEAEEAEEIEEIEELEEIEDEEES